MSWIRKCYLDDKSDMRSPIPTRIVSNEEFIPPPQSAKEKEVEHRLRDLAGKNAKKLGLSRRRFLQTSAGMAAAMLCFNEVFVFPRLPISFRDCCAIGVCIYSVLYKGGLS